MVKQQSQLCVATMTQDNTGPETPHDGDNAGTQPTLSLSCKGSTGPPHGDNVTTEPNADKT